MASPSLLPPPLPPPEIQALMDKTAARTVESQNAFEFETLLRNKQASNPQFAFLFPSCAWHQYYNWRKLTLQQQIQHNQTLQNANQNTVLQPSIHSQQNEPTFNIDSFNAILHQLNGSNHSINSASKYIIEQERNCIRVCEHLKHYYLRDIQRTQFHKKLHILFMINDVLHQLAKQRTQHTAETLAYPLWELLCTAILPHLNAPSQPEFDRVAQLLKLWSERNIFDQRRMHRLNESLGLIAVAPPPSLVVPPSLPAPMQRLPPVLPVAVHPPHPHPYAWPPPPHLPPPVMVLPPPHPPHAPHHPSHASPFPPACIGNVNVLPTQVATNTLHVSIAEIIRSALKLRRKGGGGTYVSLPRDKIPRASTTSTAESNGAEMSDPTLRRAMDQYLKDLRLIDTDGAYVPRSSSSSSSARRSRSSRSRRRRHESSSPSRSRSRSRSRSQSHSQSRSRSSSRSN